MANFNSSNSTATSFTWGMLRVLRTAATSVVAITAVLVLTGMLAGLTGCSEEKGKESKVNPSQTGQQPAVSVLPQTKPAVRMVAKKKKTTAKRPATLTYTSSTYGVSFRFPGQYDLTTPGNTEESSLVEQVPSNFVEPGGVTVATIELPGGSATSFFHVSANKSLTQQECRQFATPAPSDLLRTVPVDESDSSIPMLTKIHDVEFTKVENASEQEDVKYYHHFEPATKGAGGTCYEFALGVEQSRVSSKTLDYSELFDKLDRIMATVEIQSQKGVTATASSTGHDGKSY